MEKLDRGYQRQILQAAANEYPQALLVQGERELAGRQGTAIEVNCAYLAEHGLLDIGWVGSMDSGRNVFSVRATAKGMDFLAADGGLSAILNVVTVRLDAESIRAIFIERVNKAKDDASVKGKVLDEIKALPADSMKELATAALKFGLDRVPDLSQILAWLHNLN